MLPGQWSAAKPLKFTQPGELSCCQLHFHHAISCHYCHRQRRGNAREVLGKLGGSHAVAFCDSCIGTSVLAVKRRIFYVQPGVLFSLDNCLLSSLLKGLNAVSHA